MTMIQSCFDTVRFIQRELERIPICKCNQRENRIEVQSIQTCCLISIRDLLSKLVVVEAEQERNGTNRSNN